MFLRPGTDGWYCATKGKMVFPLEGFFGVLLSWFQCVYQRELELLNSVDILSFSSPLWREKVKSELLETEMKADYTSTVYYCQRQYITYYYFFVCLLFVRRNCLGTRRVFCQRCILLSSVRKAWKWRSLHVPCSGPGRTILSRQLCYDRSSTEEPFQTGDFVRVCGW